MAKALPGFATTRVDHRLLAEVRALRSRVRDLEAELDRARAENDVLAAAPVALGAVVAAGVIDDRAPALT